MAHASDSDKLLQMRQLRIFVLASSMDLARALASAESDLRMWRARRSAERRPTPGSEARRSMSVSTGVG